MTELATEPHDRVRALSAAPVNSRIDAATRAHLGAAASEDADGITRRVARLDREWDFERILETEAAVVGLAGLALAASASARAMRSTTSGTP
jgi:hypothetical protein